MNYEVRFTPLATAFAKKVSSFETIEDLVRSEIAELMDNGLASPDNLFFHVVETESQDFICFGRPYGIEVDTCSYDEEEDGIEVGTGPLKGKRVSMPRGDSD